VSEAQIQPASLDDLPAIRDLATAIWHRCYPGIISREQIEFMLVRMYALETLRDEIQSQGIRFDRLLVDNLFIGFAAYGPTGTPTAWKLHKLYLAPEHQGRGLGSRLLKHCEAQARQLGARELRLNVNKRNAQAIAAYQRNGYTKTEEVTQDIGGGFVMDDFVMTKRLG